MVRCRFCSANDRSAPATLGPRGPSWAPRAQGLRPCRDKSLELEWSGKDGTPAKQRREKAGEPHEDIYSFRADWAGLAFFAPGDMGSEAVVMARAPDGRWGDGMQHSRWCQTRFAVDSHESWCRRLVG